MTPRQVLIDWDWGATGIWWVLTPEELAAPAPLGCWVADPAAVDRDRHHGWRDKLSDDLIDALQAWNDRGEEVMGMNAHEHNHEERVDFWASGHKLAARVQDQLGPDYDVLCHTPGPYLK